MEPEFRIGVKIPSQVDEFIIETVYQYADIIHYTSPLEIRVSAT